MERGNDRSDSSSSRQGKAQPLLTRDNLSQIVAATVEEILRRHTLQGEQNMPAANPALTEEGRRSVAQDRSRESVSRHSPSRDRRKGKAPLAVERGSRGTPFSAEIVEEELPRNFRPLQLEEYNGTTDPEDHLCRFENAALLHQYREGVKCKVFLTTLSGSTQRWFSRLPSRSIQSFADMSAVFLHHFASSKRYGKTTLNLFSLKQRPDEALREYVRRFNQTAMEVPAATSEVLVSAFSQGLAEGDFFRSLIKKPPGTYDHLLGRAEKYVNLEEAQRARKRSAGSNKPPERSDRGMLRQNDARPFLSRAMERRKDKVQTIDREPRLHSDPPPERSVRFCAFHQIYGHSTQECQRLAEEIRQAVREQRTETNAAEKVPAPGPDRRDRREADHRRAARRFAEPRRTHPYRNNNPHRQPEAPRPNNAPHRGTISMITGGATDGDSNRARKAHRRRLENL